MERVDYLEKLLGDSADKQAEQTDRQAAAIQQRMESVERLLGDSVDRHALLEQAYSEQGILQRELDELREQHAALQNLEDQQGLSLGVRMRHIEHLFGDSAEHHVRWECIPSKLETERQARSEQYAALLERLDYIQKLVDNSAERHIE